MKNSFLLLLLLVFLMKSASAQNELIINTEGLPPITTYLGSDYDGFEQVWDITQDERGLIYIATTTHIHEFDGSKWRKIILPEGSVPRCFATSKTGRIYIGGINIFGYLSSDKYGLTSYYSLQHLLPRGTEIGRQEFVKTLNGRVFFAGIKSIIVYDETTNRLDYFNTQARAYPNFILKEKMFFKIAEQGLFSYEKDTLVKAPFSDFFLPLAISDFISYKSDSVIAMSPTHEYYYYDEDTVYKKDYYRHADLKDKYPYKLLKVSEDYNAICYLSGGLVITDKLWDPVLHINESDGINQEVFKAFVDKENNIWLATNFGVYVVDLSSSLSEFDQRSGLSGTPMDFEEEAGNLYVATTTGVFVKPWANGTSGVNGENRVFDKIDNSSIYNDDILVGKKPLLVKSYRSIGQIVNGKYEEIYSKSETESELTFLKDSAYALTVGSSGSSMQLLQNKNGNWVNLNSIKNDILPQRIPRLVYDRKSDSIWGSNVAELFSFTISKNLQTIENYKIYSEADGLPLTGSGWPLNLGNETIFSTQKGIYSFDIEAQKFEKDNRFGNHFDEEGIFKISAQNDSILWFVTNSLDKGVFRTYDNLKDIRLTNIMAKGGQSVYYSKNKGVLFGTSNTISFIQEGKQENYDFEFAPMVRQLDIISGKDSTIFHGVFSAPDSSYSYVQKNPIELEYDHNAIRLSYSIPYYRHPDKIKYQILLEGFEEEWSEWTDKTEKEYTNLPAGDYIFKVKAMNGFLTESEIGSIKVKILAPWYQTWWAYLIYFLLFVFFIRIILILNSKRLKVENDKLEEIIKERVKEIQEQKSVIAQSLLEKESLLKEIHHRVKNNLQIIANLLYLQSGKFEDENIKNVLEEGQGRVRSMALIHQKLYENEDLKSIPFGEYVLELVNEIKTSFGEQAANINIKVDAHEAFFDVDSAVPLGLIINELSTNAFKYAFEGRDEGQFSIFLTKSGDEYELHIADNGKGIPEEIDIRKTRSLGLRLVRILSEQLEGEYSFESQGGMSFRLKFVA